MKPTFYLLIAFLSFSLNAQKNIHHRWDAMLQSFVNEKGQVDYQGWLTDQDNLDAYIETLAKMPPHESDSKQAKLAYWINAYNALTVQLILRNYPLKSIKEIKAPWDTECFSSGGKSFTLGDIEHKILRKMDEPRIYFAINCASASCPRLWNRAFLEKQMENQLTLVTKAFLEDKSKNDIQSKQLKLSRIFLWFGKDFGSKKERIDFIQRYSGVPLSNPKIDYLPYDWNLNE